MKLRITQFGQHLLLLACLLYSGIGFAQSNPTFNSGQDPKPSGKEWVLIDKLSDEFDGTAINTNKWAVGVHTWIGRKPGLFTDEAVTVGGGNLRITADKFDTPRVVNGQNWTHQGGLVRSTTTAKVGTYTEARMKANKTFMSSTFWLINTRNEATGCDARVTELDIQECVGEITSNSNWTQNKTKEMGSNTHSRNTSCASTPTGSAGNQVGLGGEGYADYHIYAAWWKSETEIQFFLDGKFVYSVTPKAEFSLPMYLRMVVETYDWNPAPANGGMTGSFSQRTTYYDWVRTWKLENASTTKASVSINSAPSTVTPGKSFDVKVNYTATEQQEVVAIVNSPDGTWLTNAKQKVNAGSGTVTLALNAASSWAVANNYKLGVSIRPVNGGYESNIDYKSTSFAVANSSNNNVSLQNQGGFNYINSSNADALACGSTTVGTNETFEMVKNSDGTVSFKGANGNYISSENGNKALTCNRAEIGAWEKFTLTDYGNSIYGIKANNGLYLRNSMFCTCTEAEISEWQKFKIVASTVLTKSGKLSTGSIGESEVSIFPNPVTSELYLKGLPQEQCTVSIFSANGRMVKTMHLGTLTQTTPIVVNDLAKGLYILKVKSNSTQTTTKFMKQ